LGFPADMLASVRPCFNSPPSRFYPSADWQAVLFVSLRDAHPFFWAKKTERGKPRATYPLPLLGRFTFHAPLGGARISPGSVLPTTGLMWICTQLARTPHLSLLERCVSRTNIGATAGHGPSRPSPAIDFRRGVCALHDSFDPSGVRFSRGHASGAADGPNLSSGAGPTLVFFPVRILLLVPLSPPFGSSRVSLEICKVMPFFVTVTGPF